MMLKTATKPFAPYRRCHAVLKAAAIALLVGAAALLPAAEPTAEAAINKAAHKQGGLFLLRPKVGAVRDTGSLSDSKMRSFFGLELSLFRSFTPVDPYLSIELSRMQAMAQGGTAFPFERGENLNITSMNYLVGICFLGDKVVRACPAVGQSILDVTGQSNTQTYGALLYGIKMEYSVSATLVATASVHNHLIYQKRDGRSAWGRLYTASVGLGILFR